MAKYSQNAAKKRRIPDAVIYDVGCRGGKTFSFCTLTWTIPRPMNLKNGALYGNEKNGTVVSLVRNRNLLIFCLTPKYYPFNVECCVFLDKRRKSEYVKAVEPSKGVFKIQFDKILRDSDNRLLKEGILKVQFRFGARHGRMLQICPSTGILDPLNRRGKFIESIEMLAYNRHEDFSLLAQEKLFQVHKALMVARSSYFRLFVKENCTSSVVRLETTCETLVNLLTYLYSGTVKMGCTNDVIPIMEQAVQLDLRNLVNLCVLWIEDNLDEKNVERIREVAVKHGIQRLVQSTGSFLAMYWNIP